MIGTVLSIVMLQMVEVSEQNEGEACKHCMGLLAGILGTMVSLIWVAHIGVYMLPDKPLSTMLNQGLIYLDENVCVHSAMCAS